jgi:hypothetical protein
MTSRFSHLHCRVAMSLALLFVILCPMANAQIIVDMYPALREARFHAASDPELEFEEVKAFLKTTVATRPVFFSGPIVSFTNADIMRTWVRDIAGRTGRTEKAVVDELLAAIAPSPCPDLGAQSASDFKATAAEELRRKRAVSATPIPAVQPTPLRAADSPDRQRETTASAQSAAVITSDSAPKGEIHFEVLPPERAMPKTKATATGSR